VSARYREIQQLAAAHPVAVLCPLLEVSRSGYYGWRGRAPSRRQSEDAQLSVELKTAFEQSRRTYGRPRLQRALAARGHRHGERRIGRLMRALGCARGAAGASCRRLRRAGTMAPSPPIAWPNAPRHRPGPTKCGAWT